jgi:hypothetical protein
MAGRSLFSRASGKDRAMLKTIHGVVHQGRIRPLEPLNAPEGTHALVTLLPDDTARDLDRSQFWLHASQAALDAVWDNPEDDVYGDLLKA